VHLVAPGTFARFMQLSVAAGAAPDQVKNKLIHRDDRAFTTLVGLSTEPAVASR
jgi:hypothetical protein